MSIEFAVKTDMGCVRTNNEDSYAIDEKIGLFLVADGMGGHKSGEVASKMAVEIIINAFRKAIDRKNQPDRTQVLFGYNNPKVSELANHLISSMKLANQAIFEASQNYPQNHGMGTTLVAVLSHGNSYSVAWVGDSRVYLIRHNNIQQLSTDHSVVQEQIDKGLINSIEALSSDYKNVITRALGNEITVEVDAIEIPSFDEDYLVLCSDGLTRMVNDDIILNTVQNFKKPQNINDKLIELALENGGRDNITVITLLNKTDNLWDKFINQVKKVS